MQRLHRVGLEGFLVGDTLAFSCALNVGGGGVVIGNFVGGDWSRFEAWREAAPEFVLTRRLGSVYSARR